MVFCLAAFISVSAVAAGRGGFKSIAECQQALLSGKVANGEFPEDVLERALGLPADMLVAGDEKEIKRLFSLLGAGKHAEREAATMELMTRFNAAGTLRELIKETDDPEIKERAEQVLASWKEANPHKDFQVRYKMWINCPPCLAKLKYCREMYDKAQQAQKNQNFYDHARGLSLDDFPAEQRIKAVIVWMNLCAEKWGIATFSFFNQLTKEEWHDRELLESVKRALGNEDSSFCSMDLESLLWNIPEDVDLKGWLPMLDSAVKRKGAIAAVLVKTGNREAMPAFIDLLNTEWTSCSGDSGKINGGGHSSFFSPFDRFEILNIPGYRKYSSDIIKGIEKKFLDGRIAFHNAYFNAVKPFADTDAARDLLARLSTNQYPQTAITASIMLYNQSGKTETLDALAKTLEKASPQDVVNNSWELTDLLRRIHGRIYIDPGKAEYYRKFICASGECFLGKVIAAAQDYSQKNVLDFFFEELGPSGLASVGRSNVVEMLAARTQFGQWEYPESAVRFIVEDGIKKGDLKDLLDQLGARAGRKEAGTGEVALFAAAVMMAGEPARLDSVKDKIQKVLETEKDGKCPSAVREAAWVRFPQVLIDSPQPIEWGPNCLIIKGKSVDLEKIAAKVPSSEDKRHMSKLFRLSYDLKGASLGDYNEPKEYDTLWGFSEIAWKTPPSESDMKDKILDLCLKIKDEQYSWRWREVVENFPELARKFGISFGETGKGNPVLLSLVSEIAFRNRDRAAFDKAVAAMMNDPDSCVTEYIREPFRIRKIILELSEGRICGDLRKLLGARKKTDSCNEIYELIHILYEGGFVEKARELRKLVPEPDMYRRPDYSDCGIPWAWNEAIAGNFEEAIKLSEAALLNLSSPLMGDYSLMMRRLLKENSAEFREFLKVLAMKQDFSKRADYADALASFADKASDKDLKALAAFLGARLALALDRSESEVNRMWKLGADCGGFHSRYCKDAMNSVPEGMKEFIVTPSWYSRDKMPKEMTPFTHFFGICFKAEKPFVAVDSSEWIGPYGIPASRQVLQYFFDGSGYWHYIRDQAKAWVPGEWSIIVRYKDGVEYHQRTLLPYGKGK